MNIDPIMKRYNLKDAHLERTFTAGNSNESFLLSDGRKKYVLRFLNDANLENAEKYLEIQNLVHATSGLMSRPLRSIHGHFIEKVVFPKGIQKTASIVEYIDGETHEVLDKDNLSGELCIMIGRNLRQLHHALAQVDLAHLEIAKWYEGENCFTLEVPETDEDPVIESYKEKRETCKNTYAKSDLIHGDIHFDNTIIKESNVFFCDIDDLCLGDTRMDIALLLFDLAIIMDPAGDWESINRAADGILRGYNENINREAVACTDLEPLFKLLELKFYSEFRSWSPSSLEEGWVKRFLLNREESVLNNKEFWKRLTW
jgi:Ser/Thr protein kinase RdoA (MazF antagonist)